MKFREQSVKIRAMYWCGCPDAWPWTTKNRNRPCLCGSGRKTKQCCARWWDRVLAYLDSPQ